MVLYINYVYYYYRRQTETHNPNVTFIRHIKHLFKLNSILSFTQYTYLVNRINTECPRVAVGAVFLRISTRLTSSMNRTSLNRTAAVALTPRLTLPVHLVRVSSLPVGTTRPTDRLAVSVSLAEASRLAIGRREAAHLAVLVHRVDEPLRVWIATDRLVIGIGTDHLKELVRRVLTDPVRVENTQRSALTTNSLLGNSLERPLVL